MKAFSRGLSKSCMSCSFKELETKNPYLEYCLRMSTPLPSQVEHLLEYTATEFGDKLLSSSQVLQLNRFLIGVTGARKVLDIGVYTGASAMTAALAVPDTGQVYALEKSKKHANVAKKYMQMADISDKVTFLVGDAKISLESLIEDGHRHTFDFSYIDADKANYGVYFDLSLELLRAGGIIAVDNTLFRGKVLTTESKTGREIHNANQIFKSSRRVETVQLNVGDGYTMMRKL